VGGPNKPYCDTASGVVPQAGAQGLGYGPFPQFVTDSGAEALSGEPRGVISVQRFDGTWAVFAATATTIETLDSASQWSDVETARTTPDGDDVSFCHFGAYMLNTDTTSGLKAYNVETPAGNNAVSGAPGNVRAIFSCSNVVFALDCDGNNRRMESSARGDFTNWTTQGADGKTFEDGGALIGGRDLKNGVALLMQESAIRLIQFGAGAALYGITKLADGRGCVADRTLVAFDGMAFWWDLNGPWAFIGGSLRPIGAEKLSRWAEANIGSANYATLQGVVDPTRNVVIWRVDSTYGLAYNWLAEEWSILPMATSALSRIATAGTTIDSLTGTIDDLTVTIDNRDWSGSAPVLAGLDTSYKTGKFTGANMAATLQSSLVTPGGEPLVSWVRPESDAAGSSLAVGTAQSLATSLTWKAGVAKGAHGWTQQRSRGRHLAFRETIPAGAEWSYSNGYEVGGGPRA